MSARAVNKYNHIKTMNDVYIGRGSKWGNPFKIGVHGSREEVVGKYRDYLFKCEELLMDIEELRGKNLVCYCSPRLCHGDILAELANYLDEE